MRFPGAIVGTIFFFNFSFHLGLVLCASLTWTPEKEMMEMTLLEKMD